MELDDRCEICGKGTMLVPAMLRLPDGSWAQVLVHISCENNRIAKQRIAGARGMN